MKTKTWMNLLFALVVAICVTPLGALDFTDWRESPRDPVYAPFPSTTLPDDYFPCVLFDAEKFRGDGDSVLYKMYHQGPDGIALSYSNDGEHWTLQSQVVLDPNAFHPVVVYDHHGFGAGSSPYHYKMFGTTPYHYKMWYWTGETSPTPPALNIKFTQSTDGVNWTTPVPATQDVTFFLSDVTAPSTPFHQFYGFGTVIYNPNATSTPGQPLTFPYVAYYDSAAQVAASPALFTSREAVALAYSSDGLFWTRYGTNAVLTPSGNTSDWDGKYAYRASVLKLGFDNKYHMFYSGSNEQTNTGLFYAHGIGHAFSTDGVHWTKDSSNPIFITTDGAAWRNDHTLAPTVVAPTGGHCAPLLQMWFSGGDSSSNGSPVNKAMGFARLKAPQACDNTCTQNPCTQNSCNQCSKCSPCNCGDQK